MKIDKTKNSSTCVNDVATQIKFSKSNTNSEKTIDSSMFQTTISYEEQDNDTKVELIKAECDDYDDEDEESLDDHSPKISKKGSPGVSQSQLCRDKIMLSVETVDQHIEYIKSLIDPQAVTESTKKINKSSE